METSGSFSECLGHFLSRHEKTHVLHEFAKVKQPAQRRWSLGTLPDGKVYLRVLIFLDFIGYEIDEIKSIPSEILEVSRCIAFGVVDSAFIENQLSIEKCRFVRYVTEFKKVPEEKMLILRRIIKDSNIALLEAIQKKRDELDPTFFVDKVVEEVGTSVCVSTRVDDIEKFASACEVIRDIGKRLLDGPEEIRKNLRRSMNDGQDSKLHLTWEVLHRILKEKRGNL